MAFCSAFARPDKGDPVGDQIGQFFHAPVGSVVFRRAGGVGIGEDIVADKAALATAQGLALTGEWGQREGGIQGQTGAGGDAVAADTQLLLVGSQVNIQLPRRRTLGLPAIKAIRTSASRPADRYDLPVWNWNGCQRDIAVAVRIIQRMGSQAGSSRTRRTGQGARSLTW